MRNTNPPYNKFCDKFYVFLYHNFYDFYVFRILKLSFERSKLILLISNIIDQVFIYVIAVV